MGQDRYEEVNFRTIGGAKGANFGWDHYEGKSRYEGGPLENHVKPVFTYPHTGGRCSITGGYVVRDRNLGNLRGRYVYGDLCTGDIRSIRAGPGGAGSSSGTGLSEGGLVSFGTDTRDNVYVVAGGSVYRIGR